MESQGVAVALPLSRSPALTLLRPHAFARAARASEAPRPQIIHAVGRMGDKPLHDAVAQHVQHDVGARRPARPQPAVELALPAD